MQKKETRGGPRKGTGPKKSGIESKYISFSVPVVYLNEAKAKCLTIVKKYRGMAKISKI